MTDLRDDMLELRAELDAAYRLVCLEARGYRQSVASGDVDWELRMGGALDAALARVRHLEGLLKSVGVVS